MKKVVREVTVKHRTGIVRVVGYSATDRGTKFVAGHRDIELSGKTEEEVNQEVESALGDLLAGQLE